MPAVAPPPAEEVRALLGSTRLFRDLDAAALDEVAARLEWWMVPAGQVLCRQGEMGDAVYLVARGRLVVVRERPDRESLLREVGPADSAGEIALLTGAPRSATVRALRDTLLARLDQAGFDATMERHPAALLALTRLLATWLDPGARPPRPQRPLAVAIVPAHGDLPAGWLADLERAFDLFGPALRLDAEGLDAACGPGTAASPDASAAHARAVAYLADQEARHSCLLLDPGREPSPWSRRCLRQADRILVVGRAGERPSLGPLLPDLRATAVPGDERLELVLLHAADAARPRGTAEWLALGSFQRHHHVRLGSAEDLGRLARFLSGRAVGIVLGGGGARGMAHIGAVRALEEAGVPIDRVGGTSIGAVIGGQLARGYSWQEMLEVNRRGWVEMAPHKGVYTLPVISVLSRGKADDMLKMMFDDDLIEDLWRSYFCVSTNLSRTEVVVHRQGRLRDWIAASMTIPGVTPPIVGPGGDLLVDGGVLNNLPVDVMRRQADGPIVAIDVSAAVDLRADPAWRETPTPWRYVTNAVRRQRRPFPNILRLVSRAALLASDVYAKQLKRDTELYLDLPMEDFDFFDMDALDRLVDFGYEWTRTELARADLSWLPPRG